MVAVRPESDILRKPFLRIISMKAFFLACISGSFVSAFCGGRLMVEGAGVVTGGVIVVVGGGVGGVSGVTGGLVAGGFSSGGVISYFVSGNVLK